VPSKKDNNNDKMDVEEIKET